METKFDGNIWLYILSKVDVASLDALADGDVTLKKENGKLVFSAVEPAPAEQKTDVVLSVAQTGGLSPSYAMLVPDETDVEKEVPCNADVFNALSSNTVPAMVTYTVVDGVATSVVANVQMTKINDISYADGVATINTDNELLAPDVEVFAINADGTNIDTYNMSQFVAEFNTEAGQLANYTCYFAAQGNNLLSPIVCIQDNT